MNVLITVLLCVPALFAFTLKSQENPNSKLILHIIGPSSDGSYDYSLQTGNGIQAQQRGEFIKTENSKEDILHVQGFYSFPDSDGNPIAVSYVADENGFQPEGDHLPVAPPIPSAILKALEYIAQHPEEDNL